MQAGERRSLLAIEVGFQSVADGFVQQDAGPAGTEHDFHFSGGSFARVELQDGLAGGFFRKIFGSFFAEEEIEGDASAAAGAAAGGIALGLGDAGNVHAGQGLGVFGEGAVGADHQNVAQLVGVAGANFLDARIVSAGRSVGAHHQFDLGGDFGVDRRQRHRIETARRLLLKAYDRGLGRAAGDQGGGAGSVQNALGRKIVGVGVAGALADHHANAASCGNPLRSRLHHRLVHHERGGGEVFEIKVGVVAAGGKGGCQIALQILLGEAVMLKKEPIFIHDN